MTGGKGARSLLGYISIHIPRVGDDAKLKLIEKIIGISIHIPRVGDDDLQVRNVRVLIVFQSTSPVWGMTCGQIAAARNYNFNPHPPCGG